MLPILCVSQMCEYDGELARKVVMLGEAAFETGAWAEDRCRRERWLDRTRGRSVPNGRCCHRRGTIRQPRLRCNCNATCSAGVPPAFVLPTFAGGAPARQLLGLAK